MPYLYGEGSVLFSIRELGKVTEPSVAIHQSAVLKLVINRSRTNAQGPGHEESCSIHEVL